MDKKSFTEIFVSYSTNLKKYISRIAHKEDIEDIVQETFVKSYQADLKKEIKYIRTYMLKTAKHLAINHVNKWDNKFNDSIEDFDQLPVELSSNSFDQEYESKERFLLFCRATDALSGSVKKCFILKKVYGLSQKEIAEYLSLSESTVEKHVAKGLLGTLKFMEQFDQDDGHKKADVIKGRAKQRNVK
ncbi:RNA polymerase sigma factor [Thalassotalea sp. PLHSN55]|uniref:RNA polymerase sigma factor n=1 Tax=Thalassotalea sp. PLHSN55 TaxID=3435888 RepID=UPI003F85D4BB